MKRKLTRRTGSLLDAIQAQKNEEKQVPLLPMEEEPMTPEPYPLYGDPETGEPFTVRDLKVGQ